MTPELASTEAPAMQLYVVQHQGQEPSLVWTWPQHATRVGLDTVFAEAGLLDEHLHEQARLCTLENAGSSQSPIWLLSHGGTTLVCSVNGNILEKGSQIRLDHGDEIEFGLARLEVAMAGRANVQPPEIALADSADASIDEQFELRDLDSPISAVPLPGRERYGRERADFGELITTTQDLLGQLGKEAEEASGTESAETDPLEVLHARYLAKLRNPSLGDQAINWQESELGDQSVMQDPMHRWMNQAGQQHSLDDLLGQSTNIDSVIEGLDPLATSDVTAPEIHDSVMHLFAPDDLRLQEQDPLELLIQRSLPTLTRSEHHSLSLDSAMPFIGGQGLPSTSEKS